MAEGKFVSYLRVSTLRQGRSQLGVEAQRHAVEEFLNGGRWKLIAEHVEVESGRRSDRPKLAEALVACRLHHATLVVAKLDRLARDAHFLLGLKDAGVEFVCVDMPVANRLTVGILAMVAEEEARMISTRTKTALAAAKRRGTKLGKPENLTDRARLLGTASSAKSRKIAADRWTQDVAPTVRKLLSDGVTLREAAEGLNHQGIPARRGGKWTAAQVLRIRRWV
jgi:DNA invertase Pin-like site-specific DNA recombinase